MSKKKLPPDKYSFAIQFSQRLINVNLWIEKAEELLAAAQVLEAQVDAWWSTVHLEDGQFVGPQARKNIQAPYFMLLAYAIENYLKALVVHRNRESLRNIMLAEIPKYIKGHDLVKLARKINFELAVHEEELLTRLSRNSIWDARYPVPMDSAGIRSTQEFSDGKAYFIAYFGPQDVKRIHLFLDRLCAHVHNEISKGS